MSSQAYLSSPLSASTVQKINAQLATIRSQPTEKSSRILFIDIVNMMTEEAMEFYFFSPMEIIKAGAITRKFVSMGVSGSVKMVNTMGKKAVGSLDEQQMLQLCDFIDSVIQVRED